MVTFTACRSKPEVVVPARATPREVKSLSDVDNQQNLRLYASIIEYFRCCVPGVPPTAASSIIKAALAEALVYYYPVAGRLRELPGKNKLVVDCTAEGVVFVEAHAHVRLEDLGEPLVPPYPCIDELMCEVADTRAVVGKPLLYLQMTEFRCGGLALALTMCHNISDAFGMAQILKCIIDLARGQEIPTVLPTWKRHLLISSSEATSESGDHESVFMAENNDKPSTHVPKMTLEGMVTRSFLFSPRDIAALRSRLPVHLVQSATVFELITAAVWRCRTVALEYTPNEKVYVLIITNARGRWKRNPPIPLGFYGNAHFITVAEATVGDLCRSTMADAVEFVREAKFRVTEEYVKSVLDLIARGESYAEVERSRAFVVSDITRCGDDSLDLGWAKRFAGGSPMAGDVATRLSSVYARCIDANGEECVMVPTVLPDLAMGRFASQIAAVTKELTWSSL